jgi:hemolysin III
MSSNEQRADTAVHAVGLCLGAAGAVVMLALAIGSPRDGQIAPTIIYVCGLLAMLGCSAVYNVWRSCRRREWLRRLDHAAIFVMIAGTYTPLAARLPDDWSVGLAAGVWTAATAGVVAKLCQPRRVETLSVALYLALGWAGVIALEPLLTSIDGVVLGLLLGGGLIYSGGVALHLSSLRYGRALWHGAVLLAASVHYAAVATLLEG